MGVERVSKVAALDGGTLLLKMERALAQTGRNTAAGSGGEGRGAGVARARGLRTAGGLPQAIPASADWSYAEVLSACKVARTKKKNEDMRADNELERLEDYRQSPPSRLRRDVFHLHRSSSSSPSSLRRDERIDPFAP